MMIYLIEEITQKIGEVLSGTENEVIEFKEAAINFFSSRVIEIASLPSPMMIAGVKN